MISTSSRKNQRLANVFPSVFQKNTARLPTSSRKTQHIQRIPAVSHIITDGGDPRWHSRHARGWWRWQRWRPWRRRRAAEHGTEHQDKKPDLIIIMIMIFDEFRILHVVSMWRVGHSRAKLNWQNLLPCPPPTPSYNVVTIAGAGQPHFRRQRSNIEIGRAGGLQNWKPFRSLGFRDLSDLLTFPNFCFSGICLNF